MHFQKIRESDAILIVNQEKKGVKGYIGGAVFLEMGVAYFLGKKIFLLNQIPEMAYTDEIRIMKPVILGGDLSRLA